MVTGTLINYYIHCKRQCYLSGNRISLEDENENVMIGRALHEENAVQKNAEIAIDHVKIDKLTKEWVEQ